MKGWNPASLAKGLEYGGALDKWWMDNESALQRMGYASRRDLLDAQERAYHSISSEIKNVYISAIAEKHTLLFYPPCAKTSPIIFLAPAPP